MDEYEKKVADFVNSLATKSPIPCEFNVGDEVIYTNDYGISFLMKVTGFNHTIDPNFRPESFIYLTSDAYWYAHDPKSLMLATPENMKKPEICWYKYRNPV